MVVQNSSGHSSADRPPDELRADCARCFALCCVALPFSASTDFAFDKDGGVPCRHLEGDNRCGIHAHLRQQGFRGCAAFDCFGAGQKVSQVTFGGHDWREAPDTATQMFDVLPGMRGLHELLWYLTEALTLVPAAPVHGELRVMLDAVERLTRGSAEELLALDVPAVRREVEPLLSRTSALVRAEIRGPKPAHRGADLLGADLAGADLRGAELRGACLIAADLTNADLRSADLLGADLRDAALSGADLSTSLFLTQSQVGAATGDHATRLPSRLDRPGHWR